MKCGVVTFPGSNCNQDMIYALETILDQEVEELWHKDFNIKNCELIVLPGGFSYGDYLRSGAIARFSPIMKEVLFHAKKGGLILGICNGFQILCEAGLLPGALLHNNNQKFICKNTYLKAKSNNAKICNTLNKKTTYKIPIAHGEGRYYADDITITDLFSNDQILFQYCDQSGNVLAKNNPNGSINNIAGVCNKNGNIMGMMPHPERAVDSLLGNTDGIPLFNSLLK